MMVTFDRSVKSDQSSSSFGGVHFSSIQRVMARTAERVPGARTPDNARDA